VSTFGYVSHKFHKLTSARQNQLNFIKANKQKSKIEQVSETY